jgi:xanthine dehydrogenase YagS FAD-binding subunit
MLPSFAYVRPRTIREAVRLLAAPGAVAHAGGTDVLGYLRDHIVDARTLVSLSGLRELEGISERPDGSLRIGARATHADVSQDPRVRGRWTAIAQAADEAANPQQRNQGTIGGNLCQRPHCGYFRGDYQCVRKGGNTCFAMSGENERHAIFGGSSCYMVHPSDVAAPLVALDAELRIAGPSGARTLPIESFFVRPEQDATRENILAPGEIVIDAIVPLPTAGLKSTYTLARQNGSWDFALAGAAIAIDRPGEIVRRARIVLSGVAPIPWRVPAAEAALLGKRLDAATVHAAAEAAVVGAQPLEKNAYKIGLVRGILESALLALA